MSDEVSLRLAREDDLAMLEELTRDPSQAGEFQWFGWWGLRHWRRTWEDNGLISDDGGTLIVARADSRLGLVDWRKHPVTRAAFCWEIGILLVPEARGHGYGTLAQRLLVDYLFAHTTVHRIWAGTEVDNVAERRSLDKAGFTLEGVSRGTGWRDGAWRDGAIYSILRTDLLG